MATATVLYPRYQRIPVASARYCSTCELLTDAPVSCPSCGLAAYLVQVEQWFEKNKRVTLCDTAGAF